MNRKLMFETFAGGGKPRLNAEQAICFARILQRYKDDPLGFVLWAFPWGVPGTRLANSKLEKWQAKTLDDIGKELRAGAHVIRVAVSSGHGSGKSALMAMLNIWFISTHPHPQMVTTANTEQQLKNKTWRELAVWLNMSLVSWMFTHSATALKNNEYPTTWNANAVPWSEGNAEAFAGTHEKYVMILFDEASKIPALIWETAFGALTTPGAIMVAFGNPTKNSGYFYNVFGKYRNRWITHKVDVRDIEGDFQNKALLDEWIEDYGIDSDFCRVRILGEFPRQASLQFIPSFLVDDAMVRNIKDEDLSPLSPKIMCVDIARQGDDHSVITWRKANKILGYQMFQIPDLMKIAQKIAIAIEDTQPDACFIDAQGMGVGVYDRLVQLGYAQIVIPVYWGEGAQESKVYINKRVECWARMKSWLKSADIPNDDRLREELISPEFAYERKTERMKLETKSDMKARGLDSPDIADSIALGFAEIVPSTRDRLEGSGAMEPDYA